MFVLDTLTFSSSGQKWRIEQAYSADGVTPDSYKMILSNLDTGEKLKVDKWTLSIFSRYFRAAHDVDYFKATFAHELQEKKTP